MSANVNEAEFSDLTKRVIHYSGNETGILPVNTNPIHGNILNVMEMLAAQGMTMACVTHEMGFARHVANRIFFIHDGQILEENTPDEFFDNPRLPRAQDFLS